jgi:hypothetical protein
MTSRLRLLGSRIKQEAKRILGIFVYLWIVFAVLILHERVVLSQHGIGHQFYGLAFLNSWIFAKIMLVTESLDRHWGRADRPLIQPVLIRSFGIAVLLVGAYALEETALGLWRGRTLASSVPTLGGGGLQGLASVTVIMAVALVPYFAYRELGRVLGRERLSRGLFRDGRALGIPAGQ